MYTYCEQKEALDAVWLREGQQKRIDCPFCGGQKTLSVSRRQGRRMWQCFRASCPAKGVAGAEMDAEAIRSRLSGDVTTKRRSAPVPEHLSRPEHHAKATAYLQSVSSWQAYEEGLIKVRYAPAEDRVLFFFPEDRGAVGRSLNGQKPKWRAYGDISGLLTVGSGDTAVLVEDAASACSISRFLFCSGCALLGTELRSEQKSQLMAYQRVIIALDKDASRKAVAMKSKIEARAPTSVVLLEEDLKFCTLRDIERLIK
jgi:ribosomal protein L37AE/L43A